MQHELDQNVPGHVTMTKPYSASAFSLCIAGYVIVALLAHSPFVQSLEWNMWTKLAFAILAIPMFVVGLMMQGIPGSCIEQWMRNSRSEWIRARADWAWGIWFAALILYGVFVLPLD